MQVSTTLGNKTESEIRIVALLNPLSSQAHKVASILSVKKRNKHKQT